MGIHIISFDCKDPLGYEKSFELYTDKYLCYNNICPCGLLANRNCTVESCEDFGKMSNATDSMCDLCPIYNYCQYKERMSTEYEKVPALINEDGLLLHKFCYELLLNLSTCEDFVIRRWCTIKADISNEKVSISYLRDSNKAYITCHSWNISVAIIERLFRYFSNIENLLITPRQMGSSTVELEFNYLIRKNYERN